MSEADIRGVFENSKFIRATNEKMILNINYLNKKSVN